MSKGLIGRKVGMTTVFAEDGTAHAVTVIEVAPNLVFGHRTKERDGYVALQVAHEPPVERGAVEHEVVGRTPLRQHQRERLAIGEAA